MKVGKEEVAGLFRAVEIFLDRDEGAVFAEWKRKAQVVADHLQGITGVTARVVERDGRSRPPEAACCFVTIAGSGAGAGEAIADKLARGNPSIHLRPLPDGFFVSP